MATENESNAAGLLMKPQCQKCDAALSATGEAYICTYECTFCPACTEAMQHVCPNCSGELVRRPRPPE